MIKIYYDNFCVRTENALRFCIAHGITLCMVKMKEGLRDKYEISSGPIIFSDDNIVGTLNDLKENLGEPPR